MSSIRVNPDLYLSSLTALENTRQNEDTALQEVSTGLRVNVPSDDPAAAAANIGVQDQLNANDVFEQNITSVTASMQTADSALSSAVSLVNQAISYGTEGANGTLNSSDRQAIAVEVQGIQSQMLSLANLSYQGSFVFAGTATQTAPYVLDSTSPSGVRYVGNSKTNSITLGNNVSLQTNLPGSELFSSPDNDVFQALQDLITNLQSGDTAGISTAVSEVSGAYNYINGQRVFYGNTLNQLNSQQTYLTSQTTQLAQQQNTLGGADLASVISNLENAQVSRQAALESMANTLQTNLFNFLK